MIKILLLLGLLALTSCGDNASLKIGSKTAATNELQAVISKPSEGLVASDACGRKELEELYCEAGESLVLVPESSPSPVEASPDALSSSASIVAKRYTCIKDSVAKSAVQAALSAQGDISDLVCEKPTVDELLCEPGQSLILLRKCGTVVPELKKGSVVDQAPAEPTGAMYRCFADSNAPTPAP